MAEIITAILPDEIRRAKKRIRIGHKVKVIDGRKYNKKSTELGEEITVKVIAKYPHLVHLDNGMSVTYAQLAMYYRGGKKTYMC